MHEWIAYIVVGIKLVRDELVDLVLGEEREEKGFRGDVLHQYGERLEDLHADGLERPLRDVHHKVMQHVLFKKEAA